MEKEKKRLAANGVDKADRGQLGGWVKDSKAVNPGAVQAALLANAAERENGQGNGLSHPDGALVQAEHQEPRPS